MSRFSRAEAEAAGWRIVHERDAFEVTESSTQGRTRVQPASIVAEKYVSLPGQTATLIHEEAESEGKLLERIFAYEQQLQSKVRSEPAPVDESGEPRVLDVDDEGNFALSDEVAGTVILPADPNDLSADAPTTRVSDAVFSARDTTDFLIVRDPETGETKSVSHAGAREDVSDAIDARQLHKKAIEDRRTAEPVAGRVEQIEVDTSARIDTPGQGAGGVLVVREGEEAGDVSARKEALKKDAEDSRTVALEDQAFLAVAPEHAEALAGTDVSIQERSDLGSEIPRVGRVPQILDDEGRDPGIEAVSVEPATASLDVEARSEAVEETAKEARDEDLATADDDEHQAEAREEGAQAAQDAADEAEESQEDSDAPEATTAAQKAAEELGVDLSNVKGTGRDGRVTKPDVERAAEEA